MQDSVIDNFVYDIENIYQSRLPVVYIELFFDSESSSKCHQEHILNYGYSLICIVVNCSEEET